MRINSQTNFFMMKEDKCRIRFKQDDVLGWKLDFEGECKKEKEIIRTLPEKRREYLERRSTHSSDNSSILSS